VAPPVAEAIQHILDRTRFYGLAAGIHTGSPEGALRRAAAGFQLVTIGSDANFIAKGAQSVLAAMRTA